MVKISFLAKLANYSGEKKDFTVTTLVVSSLRYFRPEFKCGELFATMRRK